MKKQLKYLRIVMINIVVVTWFGLLAAPVNAQDSWPNAPVEDTGQQRCWDPDDISDSPMTGRPMEIDCVRDHAQAKNQDGAVPSRVQYPEPRFSDNADGTVTDNLTGLIWLRHANCFFKKTWEEALETAGSLEHGECCETDPETDRWCLSDGSSAGQWRLPNIKELQSLIDYNYTYPAIPDREGTGQCQSTTREFNGCAFIGVMERVERDLTVVPDKGRFYWSSTTSISYKRREPRLPDDKAYGVSTRIGNTIHHFKNHTSEDTEDTEDTTPRTPTAFYIWPVRGLSRGTPAPVEVTGQKICYRSEETGIDPPLAFRRERIPCEVDSIARGQDGSLKQGVPYPAPRFLDKEDGTVLDHQTGLIWLKNADCFRSLTWAEALQEVSDLQNGDCCVGGTSCLSEDDSKQTQWRLPNVKELQSLIDFGNDNPEEPDTPALPQGHPFDNVNPNFYWSSTTFASEWDENPGEPDDAWAVSLRNGLTVVTGTDIGMDTPGRVIKKQTRKVWPVRSYRPSVNNVTIVYPFDQGTYPLVDPSSSLDSAYIPLSFNVICPGGAHTVRWHVDRKKLGEAIFYDQTTIQQIWKLPGGRHFFTVDVDNWQCGFDSVSFQLGR